MRYLTVTTPVGRLWVAHQAGRVWLSLLTEDRDRFLAECERRLDLRPEPGDDPQLREQIQQRLTTDSEMDFALEVYTPFQQAVLRAVAAIPRGEVRTYAEVAKAVGHPRAARAVGEVMRTNPIPLLIPCHRVVRSGGDPGNYSPHPQVKRRLLDLEGAVLRRNGHSATWASSPAAGG